VGVLTPLLLAGLAVLSAGLLPRAVMRWRALRRTPAAAMVLWQSLTLVSVLAALGAGLSLATWSVLPTADPQGWVVAGISLTLTFLVLARLLLCGHRVGTVLRRHRREHRARLDLVSERMQMSGQIVDRLEDEQAVAYCVPGLGRARTVVTAGALRRLDEGEARAVLAHERAHLRSRHDLVIEAFAVLQSAFPRLATSGAALEEVRLLTELLADRAATRTVGRLTLGRALLAIGEARGPEAVLPFGGHLAVRIALLADSRARPLQSTLVITASVLLLAVPTAVVVWPWLSTLV
jgi:Zn-dependent protease with chaperone function